MNSILKDYTAEINYLSFVFTTLNKTDTTIKQLNQMWC